MSSANLRTTSSLLEGQEADSTTTEFSQTAHFTGFQPLQDILQEGTQDDVDRHMIGRTTLMDRLQVNSRNERIRERRNEQYPKEAVNIYPVAVRKVRVAEWDENHKIRFKYSTLQLGDTMPTKAKTVYSDGSMKTGPFIATNHSASNYIQPQLTGPFTATDHSANSMSQQREFQRLSLGRYLGPGSSLATSINNDVLNRSSQLQTGVVAGPFTAAPASSSLERESAVKIIPPIQSG